VFLRDARERLAPRCGAAVLALSALLLPLHASAGGGDPDNGESVVRNVCVTCHKLPDGTGNAVGPPLADTIPADGWSAEAVEENVNLPHHASAKAQVSQPDYADIAAYLNQFR